MMNKKTILHIIQSGIFMFLAILSFIACTDKNDWDVDSSYDRLFSITTMSVSTYATYVEFSFNKNPKADYYIIELSKELLDDAIGIGESTGSIVYGKDKSITVSPVTLDNLDSETTYYLRMRAMSLTIEDSKWSYLSDSFKTKAEQIFNAIGTDNVTATSVTLSWLAGADATHIDIRQGETIVDTILLTDEEIEEGTTTVSGLYSSTNYTAIIYNDNVKRGEISFKTTSAIPDGFTEVTLAASDDFGTVLSSLSGSIALVIPQGMDIQFEEALIIPSTLNSIIFWGEDGSNIPKLRAKGFAGSEGGTFELIKFYNLELYNPSSSDGYIFNQNKTATIGTISIEKCIVKDTRGVIRAQGTGTTTSISTIEFSNVIFTNIGDYGLVNSTVSTIRIQSVNMTNSTVNKQASRMFDYNSMTTPVITTIDHCSFYSFVSGSNNDFLRFTASVGTSLAVNNSVFGATPDKIAVIKATSTAGYATYGDNVYYTSDCGWVTNNRIGELYSNTSEGLFANPSNGDFTIKDGFFPGKRSCGDPRWYMPE